MEINPLTGKVVAESPFLSTKGKDVIKVESVSLFDQGVSKVLLSGGKGGGSDRTERK